MVCVGRFLHCMMNWIKLSQIEKQEQYSHRNCFLIHGIPESKDEDTDQIVMDNVRKEMDIHLTPYDIDRSHRVGSFKKEKGRML